MPSINTEELIKLDAYYKITPGSKAKKAWERHWEKRTVAWEKLREQIAEITGIKEPLVATRGRYFTGVCVDDPSQIPDGFRLPNQKEQKQCEGKWFVYPNGKNKLGKILKKALDPNRLIQLPDVDELVVDLGFGYGKSYFTIGNRLYRGCGYKEEGDEVKIQACLFKHKTGKFYHADKDKLVDKLPLVSGLKEITASEY